MWRNTKKRKAMIKIDTLIGKNSELRGDVMFSGGLHVDGKIKGNVVAVGDEPSTLSVSEAGTIEGEVRVPNVVLNGSVLGDVYALEHIEIAENARVTGNVYYNLIEMAMGAEVNGSLVHSSDVEQRKSKGEKGAMEATSQASNS